MPCYEPIAGFRRAIPNLDGLRPFYFSLSHFGANELGCPVPALVPCSRCVGCQLERARQWAVRCVHESLDHDSNSFVTLTYNDESIPAEGSLRLRDFQLFMKRLRKKFYPRKIRFFHCGEYGSKFARPHYHVLFFGIDFSEDRYLWRVTKPGYKIYRSPVLECLWGLGFVEIGELSFDSAAYVARYITKKVLGEGSESHYCGRVPEYVTMSRRPGIGFKYFKQFFKSVYAFDSVVMNGIEMKPPRYYDKLFALEDSLEHNLLVARREAKAKLHFADNTPERLLVKSECRKLALANLKRSYEDEF